MTALNWDAPWQNGVQVLSLVRDGRFVRSERLEDEGRVQSWVLAGERGAAEMRGTAPDWLYVLLHRPPRGEEFSGGHTLLLLADATVFPSRRCPVLEGPCVPRLITPEGGHGSDITDPWPMLEALYRAHLEGA